MSIDSELDAMCENCEQDCPEGFCKAYRSARYRMLGIRWKNKRDLEGYYQGRWLNIKDGAKIAGCNSQTLYHRIARNNMTFTEAIEIGGSRKTRLPDITYGEQTKCLADWARELQVSYRALYNHIVRQNRTLDEALKRIKK